MNKILIVFCLALATAVVAGCGKSAPTDNSNTSVNANVGAPEVNYPDAASALTEGNRLFDINKTDEAIAAYKKAVEMDPDLGEAWFKLGIAYALIEREEKLRAQNEETEYSPTPTPEKPEKQPTRTKDSEKAFEKAVKAYKKQLDANPKDDVAYFNLGRAYDKLDEDEDALKALREAVKLKPESTEYQTGLGAILSKLAKYDEAVKVLKKALELDPENAKAEELLDQADAGRKRINFSQTPKPSSQSNTKVNTDDAGGDVIPPGDSPKPSPAKPTPSKPAPAKPTPGKMDKKGNP